MAGDWIKMRTNLWDDPRVSRLVDLTEQSEAAIVGGLYWLWAMADQHSEDGTLQGLSLRQIDRKTGIQGFAAGLVEIGWIREQEGLILILHFDEHNGASAKKRAQTAKRVANFRSGNEDETPTDEGCNAPSVTGALAREEKRREEKDKHSEANASGGEPPVDNSPFDAAKATKDELWAAGKSLLTQSGMPAAQCGSFVGKLVKDYGDQIVIDAVRAAVVERPADPASYLKTICQTAAGKRSRSPPSRHSGFASKNYTEGVNADGTF